LRRSSSRRALALVLADRGGSSGARARGPRERLAMLR